jgi:hypothetical protein
MVERASGVALTRARGSEVKGSAAAGKPLGMDIRAETAWLAFSRLWTRDIPRRRVNAA